MQNKETVRAFICRGGRGVTQPHRKQRGGRVTGHCWWFKGRRVETLSPPVVSEYEKGKKKRPGPKGGQVAKCPTSPVTAETRQRARPPCWARRREEPVPLSGRVGQREEGQGKRPRLAANPKGLSETTVRQKDKKLRQGKNRPLQYKKLGCVQTSIPKGKGGGEGSKCKNATGEK